ncbi:MAG: hypothetical protein O4859_30100 [Trichodesmium sp. St18_bin1]|jgi:hypothetical protein|nr:hypothetical protein [Trichodesmium sp. St18_bin1]
MAKSEKFGLVKENKQKLLSNGSLSGCGFMVLSVRSLEKSIGRFSLTALFTLMNYIAITKVL